MHLGRSACEAEDLALQLETLDLPAATLMVQASIEHCEIELSGGFASEGWAQVWGASTI